MITRHESSRANGRKIRKSMTYSSLIIDAIRSSPEGRCTSTDMFCYLAGKYPKELTEDMSSVWKNNIRQVLSKDPRFIKLGKRRGEKLHEWVYFPLFAGCLENERGADVMQRETGKGRMSEEERVAAKDWKKLLCLKGTYYEFKLGRPLFNACGKK